MKKNTSWEKASDWYNTLVGPLGHYYHQHVIFPKLKEILSYKPGDRCVDVGCGQGVYFSQLPKGVDYLGLDLSPSLIQAAKKKNIPCQKVDVTKSWPDACGLFSHFVSILAMQNMEKAHLAIAELGKHLNPGGEGVIVLNHPTFRIPRQSQWGEDENKKLQYRRVDTYSTPLQVPIQTHPGEKNKEEKNKKTTFSFHYPLAYWFEAFFQAGLKVLNLYEWHSDKKSTGKKSKMENRARQEFPLFLAVHLVK